MSIYESNTIHLQVIISGKLRAQRAKSMKFKDGYMISSGQPVKEYIDSAVRHVLLRQVLVPCLMLSVSFINTYIHSSLFLCYFKSSFVSYLIFTIIQSLVNCFLHERKSVLGSFNKTLLQKKIMKHCQKLNIL